MKRVVNPFYYGNEVYEDDFCNRIDELKKLINITPNQMELKLL